VRRIADVYANGEKSAVQVRRDLVDALLHLRVLSLEAVEAVDQWRAANGRAGMSYMDPGSGENYLLKMKDDTKYLADHPVGEIFTFSSKHDPFFVVPSAPDVQRAPTNGMTPTLQARRREQSRTPQKKAVLPLQPSLLRRIHRAELAMLKEAVQARVLRSGASPGAEPRAPPPPEQKPPEPAAAAAPPAAQAAPQAPPAAGPPPEEPGHFTMSPVGSTRESIGGVFEQYVARAEPQLLATLEQWQGLEPLLQEEGAGALEWFWLRREGGAGPDKPDGLAVFKLKRASMVFGQLLHLSLTDLSWFDDALEAVKRKMFTLLPIVSIRTTLWYQQGDKGLQIDKGVEALFKQRGFKWFQLQNAPGRRGQVMECKRGKTPDFPPQPPDLPGVVLCSGQAWVRGASGNGAMSLTSGACATNLTLAAACLRHFLAKDSGEAKSAGEAAAAPATEAARESLTQALLSGELERLLAAFAAVSMEEDQLAASATGSSRAAPSALALRAAWKLQASGAPVPGVMCEGGAGSGAELVRRGTASGAFAEALAGLGVERLADDLSTVSGPQDAAFGRLFVTLDWHSVVALPDGVLELAVVSVGHCPRHHGPVLYVGTSQEDCFVVVLPWAGAAPPSQDTVFATCADILRDTKPQDPAPYKTVRMPSFCARSALRSRAIGDSAALGMPSKPALQVSEFGSLAVCAGREMPGRLRPSVGAGGATFTVKKPFAVCLWHTDIDELNVPLVAEFVA